MAYVTRSCPKCGIELTTADDMVTVNIDGHGTPAHRACYEDDEEEE